MPHLQFEVSEPLDGTVEPFPGWTTELYADVMETGTGHVCVTVRDDTELSLGRRTERPVAGVCVTNGGRVVPDTDRQPRGVGCAERGCL